MNILSHPKIVGAKYGIASSINYYRIEDYPLFYFLFQMSIISNSSLPEWLPEYRTTLLLHNTINSLIILTIEEEFLNMFVRNST